MSASNSTRLLVFLVPILAVGALVTSPLFAAPAHAARSAAAPVRSTAGRCAAQLAESGIPQGCFTRLVAKAAGERALGGPPAPPSLSSALDPVVPVVLGQSSTIDPNGAAVGGAH